MHRHVEQRDVIYISLDFKLSVCLLCRSLIISGLYSLSVWSLTFYIIEHFQEQFKSSPALISKVLQVCYVYYYILTKLQFANSLSTPVLQGYSYWGTREIMTRCFSCCHQWLLSDSNPETVGYKLSVLTTKSRLLPIVTINLSKLGFTVADMIIFFKEGNLHLC